MNIELGYNQSIELFGSKRVVLALDRASFHTSEQLEIPEGIHLVWMPPKSPELQPAERLWPLTNEAVSPRASAKQRESVF